MIVPSIDLQGGQTVQLVGGDAKAIDAGDPMPIAERFAIAGEIAVIDLDAAMSTGSNAHLIDPLVQRFPCRVGGGIRSLATATSWLDRGAAKIILGTMAKPDLLAKLPKNRVIAALDARDGEVVIEGWKTGTGAALLDRIDELRDLVDGFLVTFVEREGRMGGTDMALAKAVVAAASPARVTIAGGVTTAEEIRELDAIGADAQVGMALYTGRLDLGDAIAAPLVTDRPDGLYPTVVTDERGLALGLVYSSKESIREAVKRKVGVYQSRTRGLWVKGETSGAVQELLRIDLDCDRDSPRFVVRQAGKGFCHLDTRTCWGEEEGLGSLMRTLAARREHAPAGSYTARLFDDPALLAAKTTEEAAELIAAGTRDEVVWEAADVIFFTLTRLAKEGIDLAEVERHLDRRALKVTRRD
ncbi:phosphoribosyl-ATP pyrophosphatase /phosphoribosyl-AMP cyclohydrolase /1-(5-phosphoribosyl)-5-[(5-phosphoribosylamino)methylideneamino] imidazole-4-carboxamide isomerase [Arboricoccus pini]|uniref:Histidine biosynthesis bifunctional protein HisIE n=1 Tax=Arboricoccus pini TaxID=1963835 RepID=A0A212QXH0_9PROT|nr:phosphoribosyl-ATP diphosphatase [Arboricoccus pini]SNB64420.1 phosphoribosyl-ATP pyrophosphatase /phosphoribosyl-AMP cyclohydrolase /1-(5-phosphoribosyl)-5-[(5-phosphoribosylamino)methylideneamino] imidazole-4-carboxamide isomerase [Arboricoccus pini]